MAGGRGASPLARVPRRRALTDEATVDRSGSLRVSCRSTGPGAATGSADRVGHLMATEGPVDTAHALRTTSDELLRDLDVLVTIEEEKRLLEPGDPRLVELAARIEEIATRVLAATARQHDLTRVVNDQVDAGSPGAPEVSIEETARPIQAILADWRDAERRAAVAEIGSAEAAEANALVDRLRREYRRAHEVASRQR